MFKGDMKLANDVPYVRAAYSLWLLIEEIGCKKNYELAKNYHWESIAEIPIDFSRKRHFGEEIVLLCWHVL